MIFQRSWDYEGKFTYFTTRTSSMTQLRNGYCSAAPIPPRQTAEEPRKISNVFLRLNREKIRGGRGPMPYHRSFSPPRFVSLLLIAPIYSASRHKAQWCAGKQSSSKIKIKADVGEVNGSEWWQNFLCQNQ